MGVVEAVAEITHLVECLKTESLVTDCPHILEAGLKAAAICLNQSLCISGLSRNRDIVEARLDYLGSMREESSGKARVEPY